MFIHDSCAFFNPMFYLFYRMDWKYKTEPQPGVACLGFIDGRCNWPRGKVSASVLLTATGKMER